MGADGNADISDSE